MGKRKAVNKKKSDKLFKKLANKTRKINYSAPLSRGGIRL